MAPTPDEREGQGEMTKNGERIQRAKKNAHENDRFSGCSQAVLLRLIPLQVRTLDELSKLSP